MATAAKLITAGDAILFTRKAIVKGFALAAAAATSTLEVFEGIIGVVSAAGVSLNAGGTDYAEDDILTIASPAEGGTDIQIKVLTVDGSGVIQTFEVIQEGTGFTDDTGVAVTGGSGNDDATFDIDASDAGATSIGKLSVTANLSDSQGACIDTSKGVSVRVSGTGAQGYVYYE
jgi:hypothetical protein